MERMHLFRWQCIAAIVSGLLLSASFVPLEWHWLGWCALVPLLVMANPKSWKERLTVGFLFGYSHFCTTLHWLNEVGFGAGWLLAIWCALFPMAWYSLMCSGIWWLKRFEPAERRRSDYAGMIFINHNLLMTASAVWGALLWTGLEWIRGTLFSGIAWNFIGMTQLPCLKVCSLAAYGGIYAVSFLVILANLLIAVETGRTIATLKDGKMQFPWHLVVAGLAAVLAWRGMCLENRAQKAVFRQRENNPDRGLKVLAVQGNIPQCREWAEDEYDKAWTVYNSLTLQKIEQEGVDRHELIVWPECAVPVPLTYDDYSKRLHSLLKQVHCPLLLGALDCRIREGVSMIPGTRISEEDILSFNSVFLLNEDSAVLKNPFAVRTDVYDKIHLVPFGEFVPGSRFFPWLVNWIGMGRDLNRGQAYKIFELPGGARAGVNICFEDVFPDISRQFVLRGAQILFTVTNDAWYNESCGARQHAAHARFRAIENRRPLFRSGNNSDTYLIDLDGRLVGEIRNSETGSPFTEGTLTLKVPVDTDAGFTFYTRHGNLFAVLCLILALTGECGVWIAWLKNKSRNYKAISAEK